MKTVTLNMIVIKPL